MSRMPCRISDDPYYDYSDYIEQEGVYKQPTEKNPDDEYDDWVFDRMMSDLDPIVPRKPK